jgi:hypothetical protein
MTALGLIDSIFSRVQPGVPGHQRRISIEQRQFLVDLIGEDPEGAALKPNGPGEMIWMPRGKHKYIIGEQPRMLTRLSSLKASEAGRLF